MMMMMMMMIIIITIKIINNHNTNNTTNKKPVVDFGSVFSTQAYPKSILFFFLWHFCLTYWLKDTNLIN